MRTSAFFETEIFTISLNIVYWPFLLYPWHQILMRQHVCYLVTNVNTKNHFSWVGPGYSLNPERWEFTLKMHLKAIFIAFWKLSESWNPVVAWNAPPTISTDSINIYLWMEMTVMNVCVHVCTQVDTIGVYGALNRVTTIFDRFQYCWEVMSYYLLPFILQWRSQGFYPQDLAVQNAINSSGIPALLMHSWHIYACSSQEWVTFPFSLSH